MKRDVFVFVRQSNIVGGSDYAPRKEVLLKNVAISSLMLRKDSSKMA